MVKWVKESDYIYNLDVLQGSFADKVKVTAELCQRYDKNHWYVFLCIEFMDTKIPRIQLERALGYIPTVKDAQSEAYDLIYKWLQSYQSITNLALVNLKGDSK